MKTEQAMRTAADARRGELQLTDRDVKMLSTLEVWGVLGIGQMVGLGLAETLGEAELIEWFFNKMDREDYKLGVAARLHALDAAGYIQGHSFLRQPKAFTLTLKGRASISDEPQSRSEVRDVVSEAMIRHDLKVSAVGLVLTQLLGLPAHREHPQVVWTSTNGRRHLALEGAADLWIDGPPAPRAVEVELTQKSRRRYEEIFETYRRRLPGSGAVLYLTGWPGGVPVILRNAREQRAPFVYACSLEEFQRSAGRCVFQGAVTERTLSLVANATATEVAR